MIVFVGHYTYIKSQVEDMHGGDFFRDVGKEVSKPPSGVLYRLAFLERISARGCRMLNCNRYHPLGVQQLATEFLRAIGVASLRRCICPVYKSFDCLPGEARLSQPLSSVGCCFNGVSLCTTAARRDTCNRCCLCVSSSSSGCEHAGRP